MGQKYPSNWSSIRKEVLERDDYRCGNCNRSGINNSQIQLEVHHIVEVRNGGTHQPSNLQTLCEQCHAAITYDRAAPTKYGRVGAEKPEPMIGTTKAHLKIALFTAWWTLGLGNLLYGVYKYQTHDDERDFREWVEDGEERAESFEERVDEVLFNGCPVCGLPMLEKEKNLPRVMSCNACGAKLEQKVWALGIVARYTLTQGDSDLLGETRKVTEWKRMNPRQLPEEAGEDSF